MKICLTNATLHCGGAERAISELANYLAANGHTVTIFLLFKKEIFYTIDRRVKIVEPDFSRQTLNKYLYGVKTIGYIRDSIKKIDPDVILNFIFPSFFLLCTIGMPYPIYISIRNNPANKIKIDPVWFRRLTYKRAKGVIAQTSYAAKVIYEQVGHKNIKVIPNYVRAIEKKSTTANNQIITVGRLVKGKGHEDLLEIFASIKNKNWTLVFAGDGPLRESLEQKAKVLGIEKQTVFAGFQPDVDSVLQQSKIFAFCSYSEGFPNALLEAMATPLACISYDCKAGPADVIINNVNGFLIPVGDRQMFAKKLQLLIEDEPLRSRFIIKAAETIKSFYPDKLAQNLSRFYILKIRRQVNGKKILFFNVIPLPHSIDLHEDLVDDGYEVDFWYLKDLTAMYPWQVLRRSISYNIYQGTVGQFFSVLKGAGKSDLVIITGWHSKTHVALALYCKIFRIKYSFWLDVPEVPAPGFKTKLKQWFMKLANGLFITGKTGIEFFIKHYDVMRSRCYDFPYLEVEKVNADIDAINSQRNSALLAGEKIKVLLSNRFLKRKGYGTVLEALKRLPPEELAQLAITILGTGTEKEHYEEAFKKLNADIDLKGWVEYNAYLRILEECDVFIHASIHEPFGIPPMDAMRYGKLVIGSTGVMSCVDRIEHGVNGYLFEATAATSLAEILSKIINERPLIYSRGKKARETSLGFGYSYNKKAIEALTA